MSGKSPSKDEALEALDFIVNVLKEHEKDLDKLINELGSVTGQLGESSEINNKVGMIEEKINSMQNELGGLVKSISLTTQQIPTAHPSLVANNQPFQEPKSLTFPENLPLLVQCNQLEDFLALSFKPQAVAFSTKENENVITLEALKNNHLIAYNGQEPKINLLLKVFLSKQLGISENQILEGTLTLT